MDIQERPLPERLYRLLEPLLPSLPPKPKGGRPPLSNRRALGGILYHLKTGCQWNLLPPEFGSGSAMHRRFQSGVRSGVFEKIYHRAIKFYGSEKGLRLKWASVDSSSVKAPKGGSKTGRNPTDRGKLGVKRHIMTDERGVPISLAISGANMHDSKALVPVLDNIAIGCPRNIRRPTHLCLDKAYDLAAIEDAIRERDIEPHIRRRGEGMVGRFVGKVRRWVVERCNSWHNNFRGLKIRWERHGENYLALLQMASAVVALQQVSPKLTSV